MATFLTWLSPWGGHLINLTILEALPGAVTDAQEAFGIIRAEHPGCISVANSNMLTDGRGAG
jgi:hypothetical protein